MKEIDRSISGAWAKHDLACTLFLNPDCKAPFLTRYSGAIRLHGGNHVFTNPSIEIGLQFQWTRLIFIVIMVICLP